MSELDLLSFRLLLDRVVEPARRHFRRIFPPIAVPLAAAGLLLVVVQVGWTQSLFGATSFPDIGVMFGAILLLLLVFFVAYGLGFSALSVGSLDAVAGRPVDMRRAWIFPLRPRVLGTLIVVGVLDLLSLMMCVAPAVYVVPILSFALPVMVEEERFGIDAIRRCFELAHFNPSGRWTDSVWLQSLVVLIVGLVINYAVTFAVQLPFAVAQQVLVFRDAASGQVSDPAQLMAGMMWIQVPAQILNALATAAAWLYWTFGYALLYREVVRRKEAGDLEQAIEELVGEKE